MLDAVRRRVRVETIVSSGNDWNDCNGTGRSLRGARGGW
jgi:hypothetical protein